MRPGRVPSNQGARSDIVPTRPHSTNKDLITVERDETHFCSTNAAVESCSTIVESSLEECGQDGSDSANSSVQISSGFCVEHELSNAQSSIKSSFGSRVEDDVDVEHAQSSIKSSLCLCAEDDVDVELLGKVDESSTHSFHEGVDLSFVYDSCNDSTDNIKMTDCNSSGRRQLFEVSNSADLLSKSVSRQFKMDFEGRATFIQCTSLCFNCTRLRGSLVVYQKKESPCWRLGIVSLFKYSHNGSRNDMLTMYECIGDVVSNDGSPKMFECVSWEELSVHLNLVTLRIDDVNGYFVNQVCLILSLRLAFFLSNISCSDYIMLNCFRSEVDHF